MIESGIERILHHQEETEMKPEELTSEQETKLNNNELESASGGTDKADPENKVACPRCGSKNVKIYDEALYYLFICQDCGYKWKMS